MSFLNGLHPKSKFLASDGADVPPAALHLYFDEKNTLTGESDKAGSYTLAMSDGTSRPLVVHKDSQTFAIEGPWKSTRQDEKGYTLLQETSFDLGAPIAKDQRLLP